MPQLSKEVRALRAYESALLDCYHTYLKGLLKVRLLGGPCPQAAGQICVLCTHRVKQELTLRFECLLATLQAFKGSNGGQVPLQQGRIAVKCMAGLLETAPHFNYRSGANHGGALCVACMHQGLGPCAAHVCLLRMGWLFLPRACLKPTALPSASADLLQALVSCLPHKDEQIR